MDSIIKPPSFKEKVVESWKKILKYSLSSIFIFWLLYNFSGHNVDREKVILATVKRGNLVSQVEGSGNVKVSGLNSFYSPVGSYVKDVYKREGHSVEKGDTLLIIDSSELDKSILEIKNRIRISQNNLKNQRN